MARPSKIPSFGLKAVLMDKALAGLNKKQFKKLEELGLVDVKDMFTSELKFEGADPKKIKEYSDFSVREIQKFADKFGFEFKHKLNH